MDYDQNILFLCNHNSARSQMAEALLQNRSHPRLTVSSAGMEPRPIDENAIKAMNEIGIDISGERSKTTREFMGYGVIHHAIFLCAESEEDCPRIFPFANNEHQWRIPAPHALAEELGSDEEAFRQVRDLIDKRIEDWLAEWETNSQPDAEIDEGEASA